MTQGQNPIDASTTAPAPTTTNTSSNWASTFNWGGVGAGLGATFSGIGNLIAGTKGTNNVPITNNIAPVTPQQNTNTIIYVAVGIVAIVVIGITIYFITRKKSA
jgi:hypothetical protein